MEMKSGYKQTEVGVIPEDWEARRIDTVCRLINGRGFKPFEWQKTGLPIIRIQNLNGSDDFNFYTGMYDKKLEVEPGQLLFAWSGSRGTSFGPYIWHGPLGLLNYHTWKIEIHENEVRKEFFFHALRQLTTFIEGKAHGASALVHTQKWEMEGFQFPLPPAKAEQEAIAEALSDADVLIESLEQLLGKKRQLKKGAMQWLLSPPETTPVENGKLRIENENNFPLSTFNSQFKKRLPGFSGEWDVKRLDELGRWTGGMTPSMRNPDYWKAGTVPWISSGEVKAVKLTSSTLAVSEYAIKQRATTLLPAKSIIVVTRSGILRKYLPVAMNMIPMAINQDIKALIPSDHVLPEYLLHSLTWNGDYILARCLKSGTTVESIEFPWLKAFEIPIPPLLEQAAIAAILSDMDAEIAALETKLAKVRQLKQGMMQELLTGKIRLVS